MCAEDKESLVASVWQAYECEVLRALSSRVTLAIAPELSSSPFYVRLIQNAHVEFVVILSG